MNYPQLPCFGFACPFAQADRLSMTIENQALSNNEIPHPPFHPATDGSHPHIFKLPNLTLALPKGKGTIIDELGRKHLQILKLPHFQIT
jgi:hypothetical protein